MSHLGRRRHHVVGVSSGSAPVAYRLAHDGLQLASRRAVALYPDRLCVFSWADISPPRLSAGFACIKSGRSVASPLQKIHARGWDDEGDRSARGQFQSVIRRWHREPVSCQFAALPSVLESPVEVPAAFQRRSARSFGLSLKTCSSRIPPRIGVPSCAARSNQQGSCCRKLAMD